MTKERFHALLVDPQTGPKLSAMLEDNRRVDARLARGPRECCADFAFVLFCDGQTDTWTCGICGHAWSAPCR